MNEDRNTEFTGSKRGASILIVDDTPDNLRLLAGILKERGHRVRPAPNGARAIATAQKEPPDLILLDIMMPDMDGYEVCRRLKDDETTRESPVIFLSALNEVFDKVKAFQMGGVDYISKPFQVEEVLARVHTHITIQSQRKELERQNRELTEKNALITEQAKMLEQLARRDFLTGLSNRRDFFEKAEKEASRCRRAGKTFSLVLLDIDHFKKINDTYGHDCGDAVLVGVARSLETILRTQDAVARWGGEEFLCLLPETDLAGGAYAAEKVRAGVEASGYACDDSTISITLTLGVSVFDGTVPLEECIRRADAALYEGKESGRNCVVAAQ